MGCSVISKVNVKLIEKEGETASRNASNLQLVRNSEINQSARKDSNASLNFEMDGNVYTIKVSFVGTPNSSNILQ
ncbi:unnamed protein product [Blepharisma stoltei]|uniref:Uncharacterized protein n=1 Tax=Blepharisma stoltei TaxID=1481888 RepID=A0AAU9KDF8_9CILI|nr:unnamed protein product [Blepharisma stoltei]